nr:Octaprenyl diphosphate synthase / Dimethylallyltransferase / (2E,6E)-farnesyl diphosphate synthase / Geranylgeranyl diphosphate synthase [Kibdelosporangium sp. MJ126-NF4]CTQ99099.1 Octaprenyl diphosphate synthase (EC 2.5.1.90) / Dimethylallyltransferase (EC 2.5.1.1) / (2E,6E)-farnesyl diphosphate synthase (EC 2.5.1.10) / Geranylgeranyl diphosphate synthase (EC 2.5.1.29) [Kibdelosporangium sp. MJ126-NF4]
MVVPTLRAAVRLLPDPLWQAAGYHFGWVDQRGHAVAGGGGKMIRPVLTLLSAEAVGGVATGAVPAAVAVELVHNFSLLHDDVMDGDRTRRHRPTVWAVFGIPTAILAGDALWALALRVLADTDADDAGPRAARGMRMLSVALELLMAGQSADMDFEARADVGLRECQAMVAGKTGAVLGCACALGALFGGGSPHQIDCLRQMGEWLGSAFQVVDDVLGIWGDPAVTGKPVHSDLRNRKKSLPVVAALGSGTAAGAELARLYRLDRSLTDAEVDRAALLVEAAGGRSWAQQQAQDCLAAALTSLREATPAPVPAAELAALAALITHRDH